MLCYRYSYLKMSLKHTHKTTKANNIKCSLKALALIIDYLFICVSTRRDNNVVTFSQPDFIFNISISISGQFISKALVAKCQVLSAAKCHEHYQNTHLDAIFCTNDAFCR